MNSPPIGVGILVLGLGCSLGVWDSDPWPPGLFGRFNLPDSFFGNIFFWAEMEPEKTSAM